MDQGKRRVVVIDDDTDFCNIIKIVGQREFGPIEIRTVSCFAELGSYKKLGAYDLVILDYYLDDINAREVCRYVETFFPALPVVLISGETYIMKEDMDAPRCVRSFVSKACGVRNILETSLSFIRQKDNALFFSDKKIDKFG